MSQKSQTQNREILTGTRTIMVGFCETQHAAFLAQAGEYLFEQSERAKADNEGRQLFEARQTLEQAGDSLLALLDGEVKKSYKACFPTNNASSAGALMPAEFEEELGLVDEAQMEITVAINSMSHRVESDCADLLFGLAKRMALLNRGIKVDEESSPYSPRTYCNAYVKFLDGQNPDQSVRLVLLKMFERYFLKKLSSLYEELNQYLVAANVLPNLRYQANKLVKPKRRSSDQHAAESEQRQSELYKNIESIIGGDNVPIDPRQPVMSVDQVIAELSALQQQQAAMHGDFLSRPSMQAFPSTNTLPLQQVLEVVSTLFGMVNSETQIASPVKNLMSHLQAPYAKIALQDPSFLQNPQHAARQLFSSMVGASEQWTDPDTDSSNELVQRINAVVERITQETSGDKKHDLALFGELLAEFSGYVETFEHKVKLTEQRSVQAAEGREKLKENQLKVEELIAEKIGDESLPGPVVELISEVWSSFMTYTLLRHGEGTDEWKQAVRTIDTILWYIEPKTNPAETKLAGDIRQSLHDSLTSGMQSVGLDAAEIKSKLAAMDLCQKLATENSAQHAGGSAANSAQNSSAKADPAAARVQSDRADDPAGAQSKPAKSSNSRPTKSRIEQQRQARQQAHAEREKNVSALVKPDGDTVPAAQTSASPDILGKLAKSLDQGARGAAAASNKVGAAKRPEVIKQGRQAPQHAIDDVLKMKFGTWLNWNKPGEKPQELKLTWYNTRTQNCMLSNHRGKEVAVVTANIIALGMQDGWIEIVDRQKKKPLFERMLESMGGQAQNNATSSARATANYGTKH